MSKNIELTLIQQNDLIERINQLPVLQYSRIVFFDGRSMHELRPLPPMCMSNPLTVVVRKLSTHEQLPKNDITPI